MSTITLTTATPAQGLLGKVSAWVGHAWTSRRDRLAFSGMGEREMADIGWGQTDRIPPALASTETASDRRARQVALAAWYGNAQKAA